MIAHLCSARERSRVIVEIFGALSLRNGYDARIGECKESPIPNGAQTVAATPCQHLQDSQSSITHVGPRLEVRFDKFEIKFDSMISQFVRVVWWW